ncbi:bifunctional UDP-N-acetylglucosamine diphosphorylase/glucosamine-1-phosphate N-acetyltransferase GlmU [Fodinicurvata fenggangensis]|uniref:bifunctional UDP-N-acetylglucosamine diphosphorylase/glucosamine-1-phosphate N-acetyltransferase GlmU n=1 Tax=Fodinicurvata fenggangensis TaxID=1121830 RepID=UPI00047AE291|nr:bifunctional UDP-N-acetylglucosamine diphosphorylase/glucosamine-1-phosphate N-acetyltransferase GlmU [Fodinicurvata fenggangensis]
MSEGTPLNVVILAAGQGTRMRSAKPKVLHEVAGLPMVRHVLKAAEQLEPSRIAVVVGPDMPQIAEAVAPWPVIVQQQRLGTADAVRTAAPLLKDMGEKEDLLVLYGDGPLITAETLHVLQEQKRSSGAELVWLGFRPPDPTGYGRLLLAEDGTLEAIVEEKDASDEQRRVALCWAGYLLGDARGMLELLEQVDNDNAKGEYYLTDLVRLGRAIGRMSRVSECGVDEVTGVNSRSELAQAEKLMQERLRRRAMEQGVTLVDPDTVWLSHDTELATDVVVHPNVVFGPGVRVAEGVEILSFSHLEGARIAEGARIGPYARLRPGSEIGEKARVGNFVEIKATRLGAGAKANHLSYLGDATVGADANIGAGTITCNYDGYDKHHSDIGAGAFIGSNTALVAPVRIGANAIVGAGSTITGDVPDDALGLARAEQTVRPDAAARFRAQRKNSKETS